MGVESSHVPLREAWEAQAECWATLARDPSQDRIFRDFSGPEMLRLVPAPGRRTLDLGCGEGRLARQLAERGHRVVGVDGSPTLVRLAAAEDPGGEYLCADAAALPFDDAAFDLAVAFMSLQDMDDVDGAVRETARVLEPGARFCAAFVHPIQSAGTFEPRAADAPFVIRGSYLESFRYEQQGLATMHRPLEAYLGALEDAGLLVERLLEPPLPEAAFRDEASARWRRLPLFLFLRAVKPK